MLIALDYDGTYTEDPELWNKFIASAKERGHQVICVTMRYPHEHIDGMPLDVIIYTSRAAKELFLASCGKVPDIWIDDHPRWIFESAA